MTVTRCRLEHCGKYLKNLDFYQGIVGKMALLLCLWLLVNVQRRLRGLIYSLILNDGYYKASWREALFTAIRSDWGCLWRVSQLFFGYTMNGGLIEYEPFGGGLVGCVSWQRPLFLFFFPSLSLLSVLFCRKVMAQQWSVVSGFTGLNSPWLPSCVCVHLPVLSKCIATLTFVCLCACLCVHGHVSTWALLSQTVPRNPPTPTHHFWCQS